MDLSEEDRKRIYEEEKARIEARPSLSKPLTKNEKTWFWPVLIILIGLIAVISVRDSKNKNYPPSDLDVYSMATYFVEQKLVSPSSADFAPMSRAEIGPLKNKPSQYLVRSYVDAQNGFGAMVRTRFEIIMSYDKETDVWRVVSFKNL
ncbi:MAG: hypothetical protein ACYC09_13955 [Bacteroidota bacterium]